MTDHSSGSGESWSSNGHGALRHVNKIVGLLMREKGEGRLLGRTQNACHHLLLCGSYCAEGT